MSTNNNKRHTTSIHTKRRLFKLNTLTKETTPRTKVLLRRRYQFRNTSHQKPYLQPTTRPQEVSKQLLLNRNTKHQQPNSLRLYATPSTQPPLRLRQYNPILTLMSKQLPNLLLSKKLQTIHNQCKTKRRIRMRNLRLTKSTSQRYQIPPPLPT